MGYHRLINNNKEHHPSPKATSQPMYNLQRFAYIAGVEPAIYIQFELSATCKEDGYYINKSILKGKKLGEIIHNPYKCLCSHISGSTPAITI